MSRETVCDSILSSVPARVRRLEDGLLFSFLFDRRQFHLFEEDRRSDDGRRWRSASGAIVDGGNIARCDDFSQTPHIHRAELAAPDGLFASVGDINLVNSCLLYTSPS